MDIHSIIFWNTVKDFSLRWSGIQSFAPHINHNHKASSINPEFHKGKIKDTWAKVFYICTILRPVSPTLKSTGKTGRGARACLYPSNAFHLLFTETTILSFYTYIFPFIVNCIILLETQGQLAKICSLTNASASARVSRTGAEHCRWAHSQDKWTVCTC